MKNENKRMVLGAVCFALLLIVNISVSLTDYRLMKIRLSDFYVYQALGKWDLPAVERKAMYRSGVEEFVQCSKPFEEVPMGKRKEAMLIKKTVSVKDFYYPRTYTK